MQRSPVSSSASSDPLLALVNATAEWHAGIPGACSASIRLLDRVHFTVYRGDCVVVQHDDPASARVLLAALGGHDATSRQLHGERHCAPGVRIRRCSVPVGAVSALEAGWQRLGSDLAAPVLTMATVHLLRASRSVAVTAQERAQWTEWAYRVRTTGGALVVVAPAQPRPATAGTAPGMLRATAPATLREEPESQYMLAPPVRRATGVRSRSLWLHHGRLCNLRVWE